jgi:hypothetical protein
MARQRVQLGAVNEPRHVSEHMRGRDRQYNKCHAQPEGHRATSLQMQTSPGTQQASGSVAHDGRVRDGNGCRVHVRPVRPCAGTQLLRVVRGRDNYAPSIAACVHRAGK